MNKKIWQVWTEKTDEKGIITEETILFSGSKSAANAYYKKHGGSGAGLHIGYAI